MAKTDEQLIDESLEQMIILGAVNVTCNWSDRRGGYVVMVDFGNNQTCESVNTNKAQAYKDAVLAAGMKRKSLTDLG